MKDDLRLDPVPKRKLYALFEYIEILNEVSSLLWQSTVGVRHESRAVPELEHACSDALGKQDVVGVGSGSDALVCALKAYGIGPDHEVIVPAYGCAAVASAVSWVGATPVFVDVSLVDHALDPRCIEAAFTEHTRAIIFVHLNGRVSDAIIRVCEVARKQSLVTIEDASQVFGMHLAVDGQKIPVGTVGDVGCFSFTTGKPFATFGNAGIVTSTDKKLLSRVRTISRYGATRPHTAYTEIGSNARLDVLHAAILRVRMKRRSYWARTKSALTSIYLRELSNIADVTLHTAYAGVQHTGDPLVIEVARREELIQFLQNEIADTTLLPQRRYPVILSDFTALGGRTVSTYKNGTALAARTIVVSTTRMRSAAEIRTLCATIRRFYRAASDEK